MDLYNVSEEEVIGKINVFYKKYALKDWPESQNFHKNIKSKGYNI
jgi:hypothetical protein